MSRRLFIDADVLVYEAAFAAQKTRYYYRTAKGTEEFNCYADFKVYAANNTIDIKYAKAAGLLESQVELLPESAARNIARMKLDAIKNACESNDVLMLLSGDGNYRDEIAKTKPYKGNRTQEKPHHYMFTRACYMQWGAEQVAGIEADDAIGISIVENPEGVICTIDKDLNGLPGLHYDWNKQLKYNVSDNDSHWYFLRQMLIGDATDNIPGIPGMGEVKANAIMRETRWASVGAMFAAVKDEYAKGPFKFRDGSITAKPADYIKEQGSLVWIQRQANERWASDYYKERYC